MDAFRLLKPLLHMLPPESVHHAGLALLRCGLWPGSSGEDLPALHTQVFGLHFANPLGLAAGFDKNAVAINGLLAQGFGFVEAGTVTPLAQPGNPRPRIFRLVEDEAVINRLGFNNEGLGRFSKNFNARDAALGVAGANIGKNKDATDAIADYIAGLEAVYPYADYITVNISSPNTQGLRDLQQRDALGALLSALQATRARCIQEHSRQVPLLLKVAPDLDGEAMEDIAGAVLLHKMDGLIVSNTTISRPERLRSPQRSEQGGLSGKPLFDLSTQRLAQFYRLTGGRIPLIGVGGIASAADAYAKIRAGASLIQLYSAIVYQGFGGVRRIKSGLARLLEKDGYTQVAQAVGVDA